MKHIKPVRFTFVCAAAGLLVAAAIAADDTPRRPPTPTPPPDSTGAEIDRHVGTRLGLLREGSHLLQAQGRLVHDEETGAWRFSVQPARESAPSYVLTVLQNTFLADAQQVVETSSELGLVFEVTGEVMVYKGRNYLLLTHPPRVVGHDDVQESEQNEEDNDAPPAPRRDAESIMRDLERQTGTVQRRRSPSRDHITNGDRAQPLTNPRLTREGANIVMRRGRINRDASGAWLFVFDADAGGMADPPMTLLPCLLLERLERHYQSRGNAPVLLSGRVFLYEDRNYLLPSVYQLPRQRDIVTP